MKISETLDEELQQSIEVDTTGSVRVNHPLISDLLLQDSLNQNARMNQLFMQKKELIRQCEEHRDWLNWVLLFTSQHRMQAYADVYNNEQITEERAAQIFMKVWEQTHIPHSQMPIAERMFRELQHTATMKETVTRIGIDPPEKFTVFRGMDKLEYEINFHSARFVPKNVRPLGFCWTLKQDVAAKFCWDRGTQKAALSGRVAMRWASKNDIICFFEKDGEHEVILRRSTLEEFSNAD